MDNIWFAILLYASTIGATAAYATLMSAFKKEINWLWLKIEAVTLLLSLIAAGLALAVLPSSTISWFVLGVTGLAAALLHVAVLRKFDDTQRQKNIIILAGSAAFAALVSLLYTVTGIS